MAGFAEFGVGVEGFRAQCRCWGLPYSVSVLLRVSVLGVGVGGCRARCRCRGLPSSVSVSRVAEFGVGVDTP